MKTLILASESPRRALLLKKVGLVFQVLPSKISEFPNENLNIDERILDIARRKSRSVADELLNTQKENCLILAADTEVVWENQTLGKPKDQKHAVELLTMLSGKTHAVKTAFLIFDPQSQKETSHVETTWVKFRDLSASEIEEYVSTGEPMDKAGAYGIQSVGKKFVESIKGDFDNVVGLPAKLVARILHEQWGFESPQMLALKNISKDKIVAVSKTKPSDQIRRLYQEGFRNFGENYVQEALQKQQELSDLSDIQWHFIGHLQSNKVKEVVGRFHLIHSVESLKLIQKIETEASRNQKTQDVLLQFNLAGEDSKDGFSILDIPAVIAEIKKCEFLRCQGLMTMPPIDIPAEESRKYFSELKKISETSLSSILPKDPILSMGTSGDFAEALEEGATHIRIGTLLFGPRSYSA